MVKAKMRDFPDVQRAMEESRNRRHPDSLSTIKEEYFEATGSADPTIFDQGHYGFCWAYASAEAIVAERKKVGVSIPDVVDVIYVLLVLRDKLREPGGAYDGDNAADVLAKAAPMFRLKSYVVLAAPELHSYVAKVAPWFRFVLPDASARVISEEVTKNDRVVVGILRLKPSQKEHYMTNWDQKPLVLDDVPLPWFESYAMGHAVAITDARVEKDILLFRYKNSWGRRSDGSDGYGWMEYFLWHHFVVVHYACASLTPTEKSQVNC